MSKELTEQWRNRAIQETYYYVKCPWSDGEVDIRYVHNGVDDWKEIIAPVPTYEEYLKLESDSLAKQEGVEIVAELENAIASQADFYQQQISVLEDRVKELEIQIGAYESCLALMPDSFEGVDK